MTAQITSLQEQVDTLYANLSSLRSELAANHTPIDPSLQSLPYTQSPTQHRSERLLGSRPAVHVSADTTDVTRREATSAGEQPRHADKEPLWSIPREELSRLLLIYENELHDLFPVVDLPRLKSRSSSLFDFIEAASRSGLVEKDTPGVDRIDDIDTKILRLVLAITMVVEGGGPDEVTQRLFDFAQLQGDEGVIGRADVKGVTVLALAVSLTEMRGIGKRKTDRFS